METHIIKHFFTSTDFYVRNIRSALFLAILGAIISSIFVGAQYAREKIAFNEVYVLRTCYLDNTHQIQIEGTTEIITASQFDAPLYRDGIHGTTVFIDGERDHFFYVGDACVSFD